MGSLRPEAAERRLSSYQGGSVQINVQGGTGAGRKRPLKLKHWSCCGLTLASYSCPHCGRRRHDDETTVKRAQVGE